MNSTSRILTFLDLLDQGHLQNMSQVQLYIYQRGKDTENLQDLHTIYKLSELIFQEFIGTHLAFNWETY